MTVAAEIQPNRLDKLFGQKDDETNVMRSVEALTGNNLMGRTVDNFNLHNLRDAGQEMLWKLHTVFNRTLASVNRVAKAKHWRDFKTLRKPDRFVVKSILHADKIRHGVAAIKQNFRRFMRLQVFYNCRFVPRGT